MIAWAFPVLFAVVGLLFGSFANVVIWRVPRGESIVSPGSHCPHCDKPVRAFDNVPILSWLILHGRCRDCSGPISARYPAVEAISGALFAIAAWRWGFTLSAVAGAAFFWLLLVLSAIDLDTTRLPNVIVAITAGVGVVAVLIAQVARVPVAPLIGASGYGWADGPVAMALAGAVAAGALSGGIAWAYGRARGKAGLGMGDVKLLIAMGIFLGAYSLLAYAFANVMGLIGGIIEARVRGQRLSETRMPFGPYLAASALLVALWGPAVWGGYLRLVGAG